MAEKPTEGELPVENVENTPISEAPTLEAPGDNLPEKFKGKTADEIARAYEELERAYGERSGRISDLENKLAYKERFEPQREEPSPFDSPPTGGTEGVPPDYWENPRKYHDQWADERERKRMEILQKRDSEIRTNVQKAKPVIEQAKKETPHVFKGLTDKEMDEGVYAWLANKWMLPHQLGDVSAHRRIATWIQGEKTGYTFNPSPTPGSPVPPIRTESYVGTKPESAGETPMELTGFGKELLKYRPRDDSGKFKDTEEEFKKKIRESQKRSGR